MPASPLIRMAAVVLVLAVTEGAALAQTIHDTELNFSFVAPEHSERLKPTEAANLYVYRRKLSDDTAMGVILNDVGGTVSRNRYKPEDLVPSKFALPEDARLSVEDLRWRSFTLDAVRVHMLKDGQNVVAFSCDVPLAPKAVLVTVVAVQADEAEARAVFQSLVASIDGQSSWLSDHERSYKLGVLVGSAFAGLGALFWLKRRKKKSVAS
jgi:hypothetical protein